MTEQQMNTPLITVIVPVYKVEDTLDRCLESIVNQTYRNLEIILVDDGSPDNCPAMCDAWAGKDNRISVIHQQNGGVGAARNTGLAHVTGDWVTWVDSDDWIDADYIASLHALQDQHDDVDSVVLYCGDRPDPSHPVLFSGEAIMKQHVLCRLGFTLWGTLTRASLYRGKRFRDLRVGEDMLMMMEVRSECRRLVLSYRDGYHYTTREDSQTHQLTYQAKSDWVQSMLVQEAYIAKQYPGLRRYERYGQMKAFATIVRTMRGQRLDAAASKLRARLQRSILRDVIVTPWRELSKREAREAVASVKVALLG